MNKILAILAVTLMLLPAYGGFAHATYYHFEDYRTDDVYLTTGTNASWTFDLDQDNLSLWNISAVPLENRGTDWELHPDAYGSMNEADILHRAYLTMRLCQANGDVADMLLDDVLYWDNKTLSTGGTGTINVYTQLFDDHFLKVIITSESGSFKVDWMNLSGCYETAPTPVPEPSAVVLLGLGCVLLALLLRRKTRCLPRKPCR